MNRLENHFSDTAYQQIYQLKTPDEEYYHIDNENEVKIKMNPFKLRDFLE